MVLANPTTIRGVDLRPDDAETYTNRGIAWIEPGNRKQVSIDIQKALGLAEEQNQSELVASVLKILGKLNTVDD